MKKIIAIVAVVVIALVGLTSYNGSEVKKGDANGTLLAELKSGGTGAGATVPPKGAGGKKTD